MSRQVISRVGSTAPGSGGQDNQIHHHNNHPPHPSRHISSTTLFMDNNGKNPLSPIYQDEYGEEKQNVAHASRPISTVVLNQSHSFKQPPNSTDPDMELEQPFEVDEEMTHGDISWRVYWSYFSSGSSCCAIIVLIVAGILTQVVFTATDFWLQFW
jgi:hypothetical protein